MNHRRFSNATESDIAASYLDGLGTELLAKNYDTYSANIVRILHRCGVACRQGADARRSYSVNDLAFETITEESAYWIGFLMADGCVSHPKRPSSSPLLVLLLADKDRIHLEKLREFLSSTHPITNGPKSPTGVPSARLCIASRPLVASLAKYGVVPRKTFVAKTIGLEYNHHFWRGVIDGDGTLGVYSKNHKRRTVHLGLVGAKPLLEQFACFVKSVAPNCRASVSPRGCIFGFSIGSLIALSVIRRLYDGAKIALSRKAAVATEALQPQPAWRTISRFSATDLADLKNHFGTWRAVAQHLNESCGLQTTGDSLKCYFSKIRRR